MLKKSRRVWIVITTVLILLGGPILFSVLYPRADPFSNPIGDQIHELEVSEMKWQTQSPLRYLIAIQMEDCKQEFEVQNEFVTKTYLNTCQRPEMTVSLLFKTLHEDLSNIRWINGNCDALLVHFTLDDKWGYPRKITYQQQEVSPTNIGWINYVKAKPLGSLDISLCTLLYYSQGGYEVTHFEPLTVQSF